MRRVAGQHGARCRHLVKLLLLALLAACGARDARVQVDVRLPEDLPIDPARIQFAPAGHVRTLRLERTGLLRLETDGHALTLHARGLCPLAVPARSDSERSIELTAVPLLSAPQTLAQVGFDAPFSIAVKHGCAEAEGATLRWRQLEGLALAELVTRDRGRRLEGRTLPLLSYFPQRIPDGIAPVSPRTQGRYVLEAVVEGLPSALPPLRVVITSIARATGLPSLAVSQRVLLGGEGWRCARAPPGSRAQVEQSAGASTFQPDVPGRFDLLDSAGHKLELSALTHDLTPLDCGRAECHAALTQAALESPMSRAFEQPFERGQARLDQQGCMLDCHVVGEAGLHDGGFRDVARALSFQPPSAARLAELPHALQRLAGVRCTSCHGPGAVPPHQGRSRILRADVCATCHDAPPDYNQVAQWRASRMAQADALPETRARAECARCHTTGGFLHERGVRPRADLSRDTDAAVVGISCAACHAPHGPQQGHALVRKLEPTPGGSSALLQTAGVSSICLPCHSPGSDRDAPAASSATLWAGQLALPVELEGHTLTGAAPHAALAGGCVGCHGKRGAHPAKLDHSFKVDPNLCASCHAEDARTRWSADKRALRARAEALWSALVEACGGTATDLTATPPHALDAPPRCGSPELARARYQLTLVLEDRAAFEHNAPFAQRLLADVETTLARPR